MVPGNHYSNSPDSKSHLFPENCVMRHREASKFRRNAEKEGIRSGSAQKKRREK